MSTPKHTPGPWSTFGPVKYQVYGGDPVRRIAVVDYTTGSGTEEHNANAALIATAPVMYTVLKEAFYALSYHMPDRFDDEEQECAWHQRMLKIEQVFAQVESKS